MKNYGNIVILAAGGSSRLGSPKQSLQYGETTLLEHSVRIALASMARRVTLVLGANAATGALNLQNEKLTVIVNDQWQEGMAASIRCGLQHLLQQVPAPESVLYMACDQPFISVDLLDKLITLQKQKGHAVVASEYAGTMGIPAVFDKSLFPELMQLTGDAGAKKMMMQHKEKLAAVSFPLGAIDIDTEADYINLQKNLTRQHDS
ncbi:MAG: nucleotidyltransferase family protein [Chitinophagaceae bacterium]